MFLKLPFDLFQGNIQRAVFILNTILLIGALIVVELVFSEQPKEKRRQLKYFYPLFLILAGIFIYAAVKQVGSS